MDYELNSEINHYHLTARMLTGRPGLVSIFLSVLGRLVNTQNRQKSDHSKFPNCHNFVGYSNEQNNK